MYWADTQYTSLWQYGKLTGRLAQSFGIRSTGGGGGGGGGGTFAGVGVGVEGGGGGGVLLLF